MSIARAVTTVGSLYALMRQKLGLNVKTPLLTQEISATYIPDRPLVVSTLTPIAGWPVDHGTVADEAAMLALHTLDSTTLLAAPTFVAPGDSCTRLDDPGWRWHCIAGHGQALSDWERRPLGGALSSLSVVGHTHAISAITGLQAALDGKQSTSDRLTALLAVDSTPSGRALLSVATPTTAKIVQVNPDSTVSLVDAPTGGGSLDSDSLIASLGPIGWWRETGHRTAAGIYPAADEAIAQWLDESGNGYHLTQPDSAAYYPVHKAAILGGRPVVRYAHSCLRSLTIPISLQRFTVIQVVRSLASGTQYYGRVLSLGLPASGYDYTVPTGMVFTSDFTGTGEFRANSGNSAFGVQLTSAQMGGRPMPWSVVSYRAVLGTHTLSRGGLLSVSATNSYSTSAVGLCTGVVWQNGAPNYTTTDGIFYGDVAERVLFDRPMSAGMIDTICDLLARKWSVPIVG